MHRRSPENIAAIAREAYGAAVSAATPTNSAYAAGIEDFARYLLDEAPSPRLVQFLRAVEQREVQRPPRPPRRPSVRVTQTLGDVAPGSTVIGYSGP